MSVADSQGQAVPAVPSPTARDQGSVRLAIFMPNDPERMRIGGIASFVRGFVKFAPPDFDLAFVGTTADRPLWEWRWIELEHRRIRFVPIAHSRPGVRSRVPVALRYTASLLLHRRALHLAGWIASFHRPGTELPLRDASIPMWRVVHLGVEDLRTKGSESRWRRLSAILEGLERRTFRRMDRVYVVNEAVAERYRAQFPEIAARVRFLPNWADPTIFHPADDARRQALRRRFREEGPTDADGPLVLFAGRLAGQKDPMLMAAAFASFARRCRSATLLIAGEGPLAGRVRQGLEEANVANVRFLGTVPRERLAELMQAADTLLITSAFETGPTVGLEALASGLPVVTTGVGEVARVVAEADAGAVAVTRSAEALADGLERVTAQSGAALRQRAARAARPFLANQVLGELYAYNRELASRGRNPA